MNLLIEALVIRAGIDRETAKRVVVALREYAHRLPSLLWDPALGGNAAANDVTLPPALRARLN